MLRRILFFFFFFFNDTATTEIYTLSLHDALPISAVELDRARCLAVHLARTDSDRAAVLCGPAAGGDRKSTRLNSSHLVISYAVFCLKKKKIAQRRRPRRHRDLATSPPHAYVPRLL